MMSGHLASIVCSIAFGKHLSRLVQVQDHQCNLFQQPFHPVTIGYAKDEEGNVNVIGVAEDSSIKATIRNLAETNEVGIYKPDYFNEGKYSVAYTYILHPPIEYDSTTSHLNLKFAGGSHIPYRKRQNHGACEQGRTGLCVSTDDEH